MFSPVFLVSGDLFGALKSRLHDSNKNLIMATLSTLGALASAMGQPVEKASKVQSYTICHRFQIIHPFSKFTFHPSLHLNQMSHPHFFLKALDQVTNMNQNFLDMIRLSVLINSTVMHIYHIEG